MEAAEQDNLGDGKEESKHDRTDQQDRGKHPQDLPGQVGGSGDGHAAQDLGHAKFTIRRDAPRGGHGQEQQGGEDQKPGHHSGSNEHVSHHILDKYSPFTGSQTDGSQSCHLLGGHIQVLWHLG